MVRYIPVFLILGLLASKGLNHPIKVREDADEIVETAGVQMLEDEDVGGINAFSLVDDTTESVDIQAFADDEVEIDDEVVIDDEVEIDDEVDVAGVEDEDEPIGIQAVDDTEEQPVEVDSTENNIEVLDEIAENVAETVDPDAEQTETIQEFQFEMVDLIEDALSKLKALNIISDKSKIGKRKHHNHHSSHSHGSKHKSHHHSDSEDSSESDDSSDSDDEEKIVEQPNNSDNEEDQNKEVETEVKETEVFTVTPNDEATEVPELITTFIVPNDEPTDVTEELTTEIIEESPTDEIDDGLREREDDDDEVGIALFEIEDDDSEEIVYETVTEVVTEVHVVSVELEEDEPTIGGIAGLTEEDEVLGFDDVAVDDEIIEIDDEEFVEIALISKKDDVFDDEKDSVDTEVPTYSNVLIDLADEQESDAVTETVTEYADEEPTIIN